MYRHRLRLRAGGKIVRILLIATVLSSTFLGILPPPFVYETATLLGIENAGALADMVSTQAFASTEQSVSSRGSLALATSILTVTKQIDWGDRIPNPNQQFTVTIAGPSFTQPLNAVIADGQTLTFTVESGVYTVTETSLGGGWTAAYVVAGTATANAGIVDVSNANTSSFGATPITGQVFHDYNSDGQPSDGAVIDRGIADIQVTAYDKSGTAVGSATTDANGTYQITPTADGPYRIEFTSLPAGYAPTTHGADNGTTVQFVTSAADASSVDLGINVPADYCQANPDLCTQIFVNGNASTDRNTLFRVPYNSSGSDDPSALNGVATNNEVGSTWGLAYQRDTKQLFSAATVRRHVGLGPDGIGAIYISDMANGGTTLFVDIASTLAIDVGAVPSNSARGLPDSATSSSLDADVFPLIGKVGIGDIDLSDDGRYLYLTNLNDRKLYQLFIDNPARTPTASDVTTLDGPWLTYDCPGDAPARPWAIKYYREQVYVGAVCTGEDLAPAPVSLTDDDVLRAMVYAYDTATASWSAPVIDFPLNYPRGEARVGGRYDPYDRQWHPWMDSYSRGPNGAVVATDPVSNLSPPYLFVSRAAPLLADLEFDQTGSMILGFVDRTGLQLGYYNQPPVTNDNVYIKYQLAGDILRACPDGSGSWELENGGICGGVANNNGANNNQGPGGDEFYYLDELSNYHQETSQGGLAYLPGSDEVTVSMMDPVWITSGGLSWLSNIDGSNPRDYQMFTGENLGSAATGFFGKAGSMGDVEVLCDVAPLEIGNRVWDDLNHNGIQDPGEPGIDDVTVTLSDSTGEIDTTATADGGYYYFAVQPNHAYTVTFTMPAHYALTTNDATGDSTNDLYTDLQDSDAILSNGDVIITYTTTNAGENNHTLDVGFVRPAFGQVNIINSAPPVPRITIGDKLWIEDDNDGDATTGNVKPLSGARVTARSSTGKSYTGISDISGQYTVAVPINAVYTVTVDAPSGFTAAGTPLTAAGSATTNNNVSHDANGTIVTVTDSDNLALDFGFYLPPPPPATGILTVTKTVNWGDNLSNPTQQFAYTIDGPDGFTPINDTIIDGGIMTYHLPLGVYTVTETSPGARWVATYTVASVNDMAQGIVSLQNTNVVTFPVTTVSGNVFRDFNSDGQLTTGATVNDIGVANVTVTLYDRLGNDVGNSVTNDAGTYSIEPTGDGPYRVEFTDIPQGDESTTHGTDNQTSVQFVESVTDAATVNLGINQPCDYCQDNPGLAIAAFPSGDPLAANFVTPQIPSTIWTISDENLNNQSFRGDVAPPETGAVWGLAYNGATKQLFSSAVVRRHSGLGSLGISGIYVTDYSGATPSTQPLIALADLGIDVGSIAGNGERGIQGDPTQPSVDAQAWSAVGKLGLGDIDLSTDGNTLYATNLNTKRVIAIDLAAYNRSGNADDITVAEELPSYSAAMTPACTNGTDRPWGLRYYNDKLYLGVICDASAIDGTQVNYRNNTDASNNGEGPFADLTARVLVYDGANWSTALEPLVLDDDRGFVHRTSCPYAIHWTDNPDEFFLSQSGWIGVCSPQPILSDIEFDATGAMIIGIADRGSMMIAAGQQLVTPTAAVPGTISSGVNGGDILRAIPTAANVWNWEDAGTTALGGGCGITDGSGSIADPPSRGPGGGEYYCGDFFPVHRNTSQGAMAQRVGADYINLAVIDPVAFESQGLAQLSHTTGKQTARQQLYAGGTDGRGFNKGSGMGDLELLCDPAPIEIGNRVWRDNNNNGIQDPGEPGIGNLTVTLDGPNGTETTQTADDGTWYFAVDPHIAYTVTVAPPSSMVLTLADADGQSDNAANSDLRDSDAYLVNQNATIWYRTGGVGESNHTLDIGFVPTPAGRVDITNGAPPPEAVSLGNRIWYDLDNNGLADAGEQNVMDGVVVELYQDTDGNGIFSNGDTLITSTVTNGGYYLFTNLTPTVDSNTTYIVVVGSSNFVPGAPLYGYLNSDGQYPDPTNVNGDNIDHGLPIASLGVVASGAISLTMATQPIGEGNEADDPIQARDDGSSNQTIDFGFYRLSIGNRVWVDENNNGLDDNEPAIGTPLLVTATNQTTGVSYTTTTDVAGYYTVTGIVSGTYVVSITAPPGYRSSSTDGSVNGADGDDNGIGNSGGLIASGPVLIVPGTAIDGVQSSEAATGTTSNYSVDFGLWPPLSLGNRVWYDTNDNGVMDATEVGVAGVVLTLLDTDGQPVVRDGAPYSTVTDSNGYYTFTALGGNTYQVQVDALNFQEGAPLADYVNSTPTEEDPNGNGDANDNGRNPAALSTYRTDGVRSGPISLRYDTEPTAEDHLDATDTSANTNYTVDFGFYQLALGNRIWSDADNDGQLNNGELGIPGVEVRLLDAAGSAILGRDGNALTTTTDESGFYTFTGLISATYIVEIVTPENYIGGIGAAKEGDPNSGVDDNDNGIIEENGTIRTNPISLQAGVATGNTVRDADGSTVNATVDMALRELLSLGNLIWRDANNDGFYDEGVESGIEGITVTLSLSGTVIATTTTDASGHYIFTNLLPGTYAVNVIAANFTNGVLSGYTSSSDPVGAADADGNADNDDNGTGTGSNGTVSNPITLAYNDEPANETDDKPGGDNNTNFTVDFGFWQPAGIGDRVWYDENADGIQDAGEIGVANVTVELLDVTDSVLLTTTTNADGNYGFADLLPGEYRVRFVLTSLPAGYQVSPQDQGDQTDGGTADSDGDATTGETVTTTLDSGENDPSWDLGIYAPASIGDRVWYDTNADGVQDETEVGAADVTVVLLDINDTAVATTTTDSTGSYRFTGLRPETYSVRFVTPDGYLFSPQDQGDQGDEGAGDSDVNAASGTTIQTVLTSGEHDSNWDAGLYAAASIGDRVWYDENADGVQDAGETGVADVTVELLDSNDTIVLTTTTDSDGIYGFTNLVPGAYRVRFVLSTLPADYRVSPQDQGDQTDGGTVDSDGDATTGETVATTLDSGENDPSWDLGIYAPASLGDRVWYDTNADGVQDEGEAGIGDVMVVLLDINGTAVATTTTDSEGIYRFTNLVPGTYSVRFSPPAGYSLSPQNAGGDDSVDSDADPVTATTIQTTLTSGQNDPTWDAGLYQSAGIGDRVWYDTNRNGLQDEGEGGVGGVTVELLDRTAAVIGTAVTDPDGSYQFVNLIPGEYSVRFNLTTLPADYVATSQDQGDQAGEGNVDSDADPASGTTVLTVLAGGEYDPSWDLGIYQPTASIGDRVWHDLNANGIQDEGEAGLDGVTVELYLTDGTRLQSTSTVNGGFYSFGELEPGDYYLAVLSVPGFRVSPQDQGEQTDGGVADSDISVEGITPVTTLSPGENDPTWDIGLYQPAMLGDRVWYDANRNGIQDGEEGGVANVTVELLDTNQQVLSSTITDENGYYRFTELVPGEYSVRFVAATLPQDYQFTALDGGDDTLDSDADPTTGESALTVLTSGEDDPTWDAGIYLPTVAIGDRVWLDANRNGLQDETESGVSGVQVQLFDGNGELVGNTTTDANGNYLFSELEPGDYRLRFITTTLPADTLITSQDINANNNDADDSDVDSATGETIITTLSPGESDVTWDMGIYIPPASIGDRVWSDVDRNGLQGEGESGIPGVTVNLLDSAGAVLATTVTDNDGNYLFTDLVPGEYAIAFISPDGYLPTSLDQGEDGLDSDTQPDGRTPITMLSPGENDLTWDAGFYPVVNLGNLVWHDRNNNGQVDGDETGIPNVAVQLFRDGEDPTAATPVATTTTDENGNYLFTDLAPGRYYVYLPTPPRQYPWSSTPTDSTDNGEDNDDNGSQNDINGIPTGPVRSVVVDVALGAESTADGDGANGELTVDFGFFAPASLGDLVWFDSDKDGIQDQDETGLSGTTEQRGIGGVAVTLFNAATNEVIATTTTDTSGRYRFNNLLPGDYYVEFVQPAGYQLSPADQGPNDAFDGDVAAGTLRTPVTTLLSGEHNATLDMGLSLPTPPAAIGNLVWLDQNQNGIQDEGERGVPGVTVTLYRSDGTQVTKTTTNAAGAYQFMNLPPGNYYVEFTPPPAYQYTAQNSGDNDTMDSDVDPATGRTEVTTLDPGQSDLTWHLGLYLNEPPASIGDRVWFDGNANGLHDEGEGGVPGVSVTLYHADGTEVATTVTDGAGTYQFGNLAPGDYYVAFEPPAGYSMTTADQGENDVNDSDADPFTGITPVTTLTAGENDPTWDCGLYLVDLRTGELLPAAAIGNWVWLDTNHDGIQDSGELGVANITVKLYDGTGQLVATTTTDASGNYSFANLLPGAYYVEVVLPPQYSYSPASSEMGSDSDSNAEENTGRTPVVVLTPGTNDLTLDTGIYFTPTAIEEGEEPEGPGAKQQIFIPVVRRSNLKRIISKDRPGEILGVCLETLCLLP